MAYSPKAHHGMTPNSHNQHADYTATSSHHHSHHHHHHHSHPSHHYSHDSHVVPPTIINRSHSPPEHHQQAMSSYHHPHANSSSGGGTAIGHHHHHADHHYSDSRPRVVDNSTTGHSESPRFQNTTATTSISAYNGQEHQQHQQYIYPLQRSPTTGGDVQVTGGGAHHHHHTRCEENGGGSSSSSYSSAPSNSQAPRPLSIIAPGTRQGNHMESPLSPMTPTTPSSNRLCVICRTPNTSKRQKWYTTSSFLEDYKNCFQIAVAAGDVCEPCYQKCYRFRKHSSIAQSNTNNTATALFGNSTSTAPAQPKKKNCSSSKPPRNSNIAKREDNSSPTLCGDVPTSHKRKRSSLSPPTVVEEEQASVTPIPNHVGTYERDGDSRDESMNMKTQKRARRHLRIGGEDQEVSSCKEYLTKPLLLTNNTLEDSVEIFFDFWTWSFNQSDTEQEDTEQDTPKYERSKVIKEYVPPNSSRTQLLSVASYYSSLMFGEFVVQDIKLAERDISGLDLQIDLIPDQCFEAHPIKGKNRFVVLVDIP